MADTSVQTREELSAKVGRRISAATREMLRKAVDALLSLMAESDATDADRQAAQEALEELFEGDPSASSPSASSGAGGSGQGSGGNPATDMMAQPEMAMEMMKAELDRRQDG